MKVLKAQSLPVKVRAAPRLDRTIGRATFAEADPMREAILGATRAAIVLMCMK